MSAMTRFVRSLDERDYEMLVDWTLRRRPTTLRIMRAVTHCGDALVVIALTMALIATQDGALRDAGVVAGFTLAFSHALVQLLKRTVGRPRPSLPPGACLIEAPDRFSFPSGHAAAALSLALPLAAVAAPAAGVGLLGLGVLVGLSRCYLGVHFPGDVVMGWSLALVTYLAAPAALTLLGLL